LIRFGQEKAVVGIYLDMLLLIMTLQVPVIFDADMESDCDDVAALGVLHALADKGEAAILGTMSSSTNPHTPACMDAVNTFYKRPDIPIGAPKKGVGRKSKYARGVAEGFPHDLKEVPDAASLYAEILGRQPDRSVTIVTVGYMTNLAELLRRPGGKELAEKKVKLWVCMGGNFIGKPAKDDLKLGNVNFTTEKEGALHGAAGGAPRPPFLRALFRRRAQGPPRGRPRRGARRRARRGRALGRGEQRLHGPASRHDLRVAL
jgi:hypothetical protein